jgi:mono/diheme cytochrome c family protein
MPRPRLRWLFLCALAAPLHAQEAPLSGSQPRGRLSDRTGEAVYRAACMTCHGADGKGSSRAVVGFAVPLPDFTNCAFATAEPDADWHAVVNRGGPIRGLDRHMPAFGEALSSDEIALAIGHVRGFCSAADWPRGDLNLPRAFFTEKAFPENEAVWTTGIATKGNGEVANEMIYEHRLGARSQIELKAPVVFRHAGAGSWTRGLGDVAVAFKRTVHASVVHKRIASAGLEVVFPTGSESRGLGSGATILEPFAMWGQLYPRHVFLQVHAGAELPAGSPTAAREAFVRSSLGTTIAQDRGFGRAWSPQIEVLWGRAEGGASEWDVVPQAQVTLSKRQHVSVAAGLRIPIADRDERATQLLVYLLWDWFDGGFFEFWK